MKKFWLSVLCVAFLLCGCATSQNVKVNTEKITFCFDGQKGETKYSYDVRTKDNGKLEKIEVLYPEEIKGLSYTHHNDKIKMTFEGLSREFEKSEVPEDIALIFEVLPLINGKTAEKKGKDFIYKCKLGKKEYDIFVSPVGLPLKISSQTGKICLNFNKIALVNGQKK